MTTSAKPLPDPTVRFLRSLSILLQEYADQVEARAGPWPPSQSNGVSTPITPIVRGHRQRQIVELPGMCTTGGMRNQEIADAIDYDESNVWNTMTTLQGSGIVEQVPVPGPQRWRLTAPYRQEFRGAGEFLKAVDQYSQVAQVDYSYKDARQRLEEVRKKIEQNDKGEA